VMYNGEIVVVSETDFVAGYKCKSFYGLTKGTDTGSESEK